MAEKEKIQGEAILQLFKELHADNKPLKMLLPNGDDEHLTTIADIRKRRRALHFVIDTPAIWHILSQETNHASLYFEFTDSEDIKYVFETDTWELFHDRVWIKLPEILHRYQRRKLYRLEAPPGTRLYFKADKIRFKLLVVNVSLGGTLGVLVRLTPKMETLLRPFNSKILKNAELLFPSKDRNLIGSIVNIEQFQLIRQKKNLATGKFECAIEFKKISTVEQKRLQDLFYEWQRDYLRKRRFLRA